MTDWLCDWFGWGCADHGEHVTRAVPEIHAGPLLLAVVLVVGVALLLAQGGKRWTRHDDTDH